MRSRYCAFALGDTAYLLATWHADFRPTELQLDARIRWIGLEILAGEQQAQRASVEFEAMLLLAGTVSAMRECSEFVCQQGRWFYTRGEQLTPSIAPWQPGRNQPCPCGSGLKFKRCCA
jgi:SEC-C motif-containing protein